MNSIYMYLPVQSHHRLQIHWQQSQTDSAERRHNATIFVHPSLHQGPSLAHLSPLWPHPSPPMATPTSPLPQSLTSPTAWICLMATLDIREWLGSCDEQLKSFTGRRELVDHSTTPPLCAADAKRFPDRKKKNDV